MDGRSKYQKDCQRAEQEHMTYREYITWRAYFQNKRADNPMSQALAEKDFEKYLWVRRNQMHI